MSLLMRRGNRTLHGLRAGLGVMNRLVSIGDVQDLAKAIDSSLMISIEAECRIH